MSQEIDIVLPLGVDTRWDDNELRYALRAIDKYLTGRRDIYIVGNTRRWLTGVKYISSTEDYVRKQKSILDKLILASSTDSVSETFAMWNDDHFLLQRLDVNDIKYWKWGTIKNLMVKSQGTYQRVVQNTMKYLSLKGWPDHNFDIHVPILYEKEKIRDLAIENWERDHIIKSLYCNKYLIKGDDMKDLVIGKPLRRDEVRKAIEGRVFWSINEQGTNEAVKDVLQELYPDKSKFEI